jgi:hypothetical protein
MESIFARTLIYNRSECAREREERIESRSRRELLLSAEEQAEANWTAWSDARTGRKCLFSERKLIFGIFVKRALEAHMKMVCVCGIAPY